MHTGDAERVQLLGQPLGVELHGAQARAQQVMLREVAHASDHAEVHERDPTAGLDEEVARMRVGVEEAELQQLAQERTHRRLGDATPRDARAVQRREMRDLDALDALEREYL